MPLTKLSLDGNNLLMGEFGQWKSLNFFTVYSLSRRGHTLYMFEWALKGHQRKIVIYHIKSEIMKRIGKLSDIVVSTFIAVFMWKVILRQCYCVKHIIVKIALGRDREWLFLKKICIVCLFSTQLSILFCFKYTHITYLSVTIHFFTFVSLFLIVYFYLEHISGEGEG